MMSLRGIARRYIWLPMFVVDAPVGSRVRALPAEPERPQVRRGRRRRVIHLAHITSALLSLVYC